jgi:hypothetical protein
MLHVARRAEERVEVWKLWWWGVQILWHMTCHPPVRAVCTIYRPTYCDAFIMLWNDCLNIVCYVVMVGSTSEPSLGNGPRQQKKNCWKQCLLCGLSLGCIVRAVKTTELVAIMGYLWTSCQPLRIKEAEECPLLGAITRQWLVKTDHLLCAAVTVVCGVCRSVKWL